MDGDEETHLMSHTAAPSSLHQVCGRPVVTRPQAAGDTTEAQPTLQLLPGPEPWSSCLESKPGGAQARESEPGKNATT